MVGNVGYGGAEVAMSDGREPYTGACSMLWECRPVLMVEEVCGRELAPDKVAAVMVIWSGLDRCRQFNEPEIRALCARLNPASQCMHTEPSIDNTIGGTASETEG